jgi:hypothetical protein
MKWQGAVAFSYYKAPKQMKQETARKRILIKSFYYDVNIFQVKPFSYKYK